MADVKQVLFAGWTQNRAYDEEKVGEKLQLGLVYIQT
jgi:hypothetical protein